MSINECCQKQQITEPEASLHTTSPITHHKTKYTTCLFGVLNTNLVIKDERNWGKNGLVNERVLAKRRIFRSAKNHAFQKNLNRHIAYHSRKYTTGVIGMSWDTTNHLVGLVKLEKPHCPNHKAVLLLAGYNHWWVGNCCFGFGYMSPNVVSHDISIRRPPASCSSLNKLHCVRRSIYL